jgi:alcohol dehydrogenase class IV
LVQHLYHKEFIFLKGEKSLFRFDFKNKFPTNVIYGPESIKLLPEKISGLQGKKVLLITDQGLLKTEIVAKVESLFANIRLFAELKGEPSSDDVQRAVDFCNADHFELVIGLGGGSVLDTAKVVAALHNDQKMVNEVYGADKVKKRDIGLVLIPTTAGTGSEATPNALIFDNLSGNKEAVISAELIPDWVVLDPCLTVNLPVRIAAATGMDALCHCIESFTSCNGNVISEAYAYKGLELLGANLERGIVEKGNPEIGGNLLLGSFFGGLALTIAGTTAVHALSYPLGKRHVAHGVANAMLLPSVLNFNFEYIEAKLNNVAPLFKNEAGKPAQNGKELVTVTAGYVAKFPLPKTLHEIGISPDIIPELSKEALTNVRLLKNNARKVSLDDAEGIYRLIQ